MLDDVSVRVRSADCTILDAGCGTGNLTKKLLRLKTARVVGMDSSAAMLERAKEKCTDTVFVRADLESKLPFETHTFDLVACVNTLYALRDPGRTLREFSRIIRSQGRLLVATPRSGYENGLILKSHCGSLKPDPYWLDAHRCPAREELLVREAVPHNDLAERLLWIARFNRAIARERSFHFFTTKELSDLVKESGFEHISIQGTYAGQNLLLVATRVHTGSGRCSLG
jgi:SAM-dependent methyltransferase